MLKAQILMLMFISCISTENNSPEATTKTNEVDYYYEIAEETNKEEEPIKVKYFTQGLSINGIWIAINDPDEKIENLIVKSYDEILLECESGSESERNDIGIKWMLNGKNINSTNESVINFQLSKYDIRFNRYFQFSCEFQEDEANKHLFKFPLLILGN